jgi:uncharacterized protein
VYKKICVVLFCFAFSGVGHAGDFQSGLSAVRNSDYRTAFQDWTASAELGDHRSMVNLAELYRRGSGVGKDLSKSFFWHKRAAELGNHVGQFNTGLFYRKGLGVIKDDEQAHYWYKKSAEGGEPKGQNTLGINYAIGRGVKQDYVRAYMWFDIAAGHKHPKALGLLEKVKKQMTEDQIKQAKSLVISCVKKNYLGC